MTKSRTSTPLDVSVGIIGGGSMGSAIARGLVVSHTVEASRMVVCDHMPAKLASLADEGVACVEHVDELIKHNPSVVILAVKPQVFGTLLAGCASDLGGRLVVSIAAGLSLDTLEKQMADTRVVRVMPNLPVAVRSGASAVCGGSLASREDVELVRTLFAALGTAQIMHEDQLDAEGAVVGCAPAYIALMVDALTRAGVLRGLPAGAARDMVIATTRGVADMLAQSGEHPRAYMERVTSPGGTTAAALRDLEPVLVEGAYAAVDAALKRNDELAGN